MTPESPQPASEIPVDVSIIIPVLNKIEFTRQCLDRIWRNTDSDLACEVVVVDNASTDGTADWFADPGRYSRPVRYLRNPTNLGFAKANNVGARASRGGFLLFLNNDTLVQPRWLTEMLAICRASRTVGIVGIKQLFPYTNTLYHTGIVFNSECQPVHLYPHLDASLPKVNKQREYPAVTGACLLIDRALFDECGGFDEAYRNGYEDVDLCMKARQRGRTVVCCTKSFIYHYGQISEGRTADDDENAALFARTWAGRVVPDMDSYLAEDAGMADRPPQAPTSRRLAPDCIYFADDLSQGSALTWMNTELALALQERGAPVFLNGARPLSKTVGEELGARLTPLMLDAPPVGGVQIKWSHFWPQHLNLELAGDLDLEFFVINYQFGRSRSEPWDYWLQCVRQNDADKLPLSGFCQDVLRQLGLPEERCHVWHPGYSREIAEVEAPRRTDGTFRFLTVTNSHDLERYNTLAIVDAFRRTFGAGDAVTLVIKDYGASSGNPTLRQVLDDRRSGASIQYVGTFTSKRDLIRLYKSCDAYVSAHRGEGFGMKILDAVACGLPVIAPLFGGPTAYCRAETSFPVSYALVPMGDCLDARSLLITNQPQWAEVDPASLDERLRQVFSDRAASAAIGNAARDAVREAFSWPRAAGRLLEIAGQLGERSRAERPRPAVPVQAPAERSPHWLGVRLTVVVPTHNRQEKLGPCLDALARQSVLPQEFEVVVVDDGSTDGTGEAVAARRDPYRLRYFRQDPAGPGAARNLGVAQAAGELVLFIGDDIYADERLIEEHLLAHAGRPEQGTAILGHIDWPAWMTPNAVMDYVCGEGMLQFAYPLIARLAELDHRFFYTSNISLKRTFLIDAAAAGIRFDPGFRHAAFEDSELAMRLAPRGLRIHYAEHARVVHDHWMDLDSFTARERRAGEMAVVFYRKHPSHEEHLQVRWIADLVDPANRLRHQPELLNRLRRVDVETDVLLRSFASSYEELLAIAGAPATPLLDRGAADRLRAGLHHALRVVFDVHRTRGKVLEWYSTVADPGAVEAAQILATVRRKIHFLDGSAQALGSAAAGRVADGGLIADLQARLSDPGLTAARRSRRVGAGLGRRLIRVVASPPVLARLMRADRFVQARLQASGRQRWLQTYLGVRARVRRVLV